MRFPRMHIAQSVTNRILNLAEGIEQQNPGVSLRVPPTLNTPQGQALDQALSQPINAVPVPVGTDAAIAGEAVSGGTAADAVASAGVLDALG